MSNQRARHAKKIETVHWTYGSFASNTLSAGTVAGTVLGAQHLPETLLRIRGEWVSYLDGTSAPAVEISVGVGIILVPEGTGTTVLWSPITDGDAPWIWTDHATLAYEEMVTDVVGIQGLMMVRRIVDNKAMRRIRNQELQFVIENATIGSAKAVNTAFSGRFLAGS